MQSTCHWVAGLGRRKNLVLRGFAALPGRKCDPLPRAAPCRAQFLCAAQGLSESQILNAFYSGRRCSPFA
jgi:hypothetical protein